MAKRLTTVAGKTEVGDFTAQSVLFLDEFVGSSNEHNVMVNGITFNCLLDTGSMVTTISQSALISCNHIISTPCYG